MRNRVLEHEFPFCNRNPGPPRLPEISPPRRFHKVGPLWNATSPLALRLAEVGGGPKVASPPRRPSPPPRGSMLSPGKPPVRHRQAAWLQPARGHSERPGPTRPRLRGAPRGADPARPE